MIVSQYFLQVLLVICIPNQKLVMLTTTSNRHYLILQTNTYRHHFGGIVLWQDTYSLTVALILPEKISFRRYNIPNIVFCTKTYSSTINSIVKKICHLSIIPACLFPCNTSLIIVIRGIPATTQICFNGEKYGAVNYLNILNYMFTLIYAKI